MRRLSAWCAFLVATVAILHRLGGRLAPPPVTSPSQLGGWFADRAPEESLVALLRLAALGAAWYLLAATALAILARWSGRRTLTSLASAVTVPMVRRVVGGALGLTLAATTLAGRAAPSAAAQAPAAGVVTTAVTMHRLPDEPPPEPEPPPAAVPERTWEVRPGQHFWAVAERVLAEAWSRTPSDREVDGYWRRLIEVNRAQLRDPGNPDLLYPGQVLTVPVPPPAPG